ncbi:hypothetical protein OZX57_00320 [Bifidobacterium sp. ESL0682]|uniref:hypothetical protein n=1 Tax=Bifidobacterium sp. ESL0682 TaxID=2983212 RepID=UPI0023FA107C|nr:hypothetical protein [Bifidobacterium sp. ESL0682]WEV42018.1 hypothetical protein OZX57_00320 [Bifidobacterium sp. ESL0682]
MAQQSTNKSQKRKARARRQAEQEALERAQAEAAAKERKQQTIIGGIVVAVIVVLVAVIAIVSLRSIHKKSEAKKVTPDASYSALQKVKVKPTVADKKGGILISRMATARRSTRRLRSRSTWIRCAPVAVHCTARSTETLTKWSTPARSTWSTTP